MRQGGIVQILMAGVVFAIIAVFVLEFRAAGGEQTGALRRECVATVEGHCVSVKDYYAAYGLIVPRGMQSKHVKALNLRQRVLDGLLERELLLSEAERLGLSVSEERLDDLLSKGHAHVSLPAEEAVRLGYTLDLTSGDQEGYSRELVRELPVTNPKTRKFDYEIYKRVVRTTVRRSPKEFKVMQRREVIAARMRDLIRSRVRVSEDEAFAAFERDRSKATIRFVRLDREWFARYAADTSDEAVDTWASDHEKEINEAWEPEKARWKAGCSLVQEILVRFTPATTDDDKVLLRNKIDQAKEALDAGESFEAAARQLGEGPFAAAGGEVGCFDEASYGAGNKSIAEALASLEDGQTSDVIESERGFHLVRLDGKLEADDVERRGRRTVARRLAVRFEADRLMRELGEAVIERAKMGAKLDDVTRDLVDEFAGKGKEASEKKDDEADDDPAHVADARRPKVEISAAFTASSNPISGTLPGVSPAKIAFSLEKADDVHPELVPTMSGFAIIQLKEKTQATRAEFDEERSAIVHQLRLAKQNDALGRLLDRIREEKKEKITVNAALIEDSSADDDDDEG